MVMYRTAFFGVFALVALGCGARSTSLSVDPSGAGGAGGAGGGTTTGGGGSPNSLCATSGGTQVTFADKADAQSQLVGRWVLCTGPGLVFATEQKDQAGLELTPDLQWYLLHQDGGTLSRATGFDSSGAWRFQPPQDLDVGPSMKALLFFGAPYSFTYITMLDAPKKLRIQFESPLDATASIYAFEAP